MCVAELRIFPKECGVVAVSQMSPDFKEFENFLRGATQVHYSTGSIEGLT